MTLWKNEILGGMVSLIENWEMTELEGHIILTRELIARLMNERSNTSDISNRAMWEPGKLIIIGKLLELKKEGKLPAFKPKKGPSKSTPIDWIQSNLSDFFPQSVVDVLKKNPEYWFQVDKKMYNTLKTRRQREKKL